MPVVIKKGCNPVNKTWISEDNNPSFVESLCCLHKLKKEDGISGFEGYRSMLKSDKAMLQFCGVQVENFNLFMKVTIGIIFGIHRTTVPDIFFSLVQYLNKACKDFVPWPTQQEVRGTTPSCFKPEYSNCRVIIDATEFRMEEPPRTDDQIQSWSHYKKGYRLKVVVGCTPGGLISFISGGYGGRASDVQITASSELLKLLEHGDIVLADKGFPTIQTKLMESGKSVLVVMPPFVQNHHLSAEDREKQRHVARVRIHIERIMQRLRVYKILDLFTIKMLPYVDDIIFMCCVQVNLQPPIIKD
ncbi:uncharacterized protein LOC106659976 [Trichogramma pretiosum]|uniref:uncharacterized protein LOC106659976 n=1 Tax=Trichogramma pretiosum TaxID=7493 RepID=UPI000C71C529|nr:uncharacterized protein LOC106659976 [Trichogramma pretiosum]